MELRSQSSIEQAFFPQPVPADGQVKHGESVFGVTEDTEKEENILTGLAAPHEGHFCGRSLFVRTSISNWRLHSRH